MTLYSIHERKTDGRLEAVPDRFSWFAALLPPLYALLHGLWLGLLGYVIAVLLLALAVPFIGADAAIWLYVLLALLIGLEGPALRRAALARSGYVHSGDRIAGSEGAAAADWLGYHSRAQ